MSAGIGISGPEIGDAIIDVLKQQVDGLTDLAGQYLATSRKLSTELQETQEKLAAATEKERFSKEMADSLAAGVGERDATILSLRKLANDGDERALEQRPVTEV